MIPFQLALCVIKDVLILKSVVTTKKTANSSVMRSRTARQDLHQVQLDQQPQQPQLQHQVRQL